MANKKYYYALIPLVGGILLAIIYGLLLDPKDYPDATYPYRTSKVLYYISSRWFLFGVVGTVVLWATFAINDILSFLERKRFEGLVRKTDKNNCMK